jgi:hypothetical protein
MLMLLMECLLSGWDIWTERHARPVVINGGVVDAIE